ncbi:MAG: hypothetical protein K0R54_3640 [Clostridiaceae bacterium]|jgi:hypothetical protein|nr:hypothetical protein [Clostridiaceae bacterium]
MNIEKSINEELGDVSVEWVYDGKTVWLVQLNQLKGENKYKNSESRLKYIFMKI